MIEKLLLVIVFACALLMLAFNIGKPQQRYVDCSLASFHPDYTEKEREMCRTIRQRKNESREESQ